MSASNTLIPAWIPRFSAAVTVGFMAAALTVAPAWILFFLLPDFLARAGNLRTLAPSTWVASTLIAPRLKSSGRRCYSEWAPKLFAARLGLGMVVASLAGFILAPDSLVGTAFAAVMLALCALEAFGGFCVGGRGYTWLSRFDLVRGCPNGVCEVLADEAD